MSLFTAADIRPLLTKVTSIDSGGFVRGQSVKLNVEVAVNNFDGAVFNAASSGNNFEGEFYLSHSNVSNNRSVMEDSRTSLTVTLTPSLSFGLGIFEIRKVIYNLDVNVSPDSCMDVNFLCINLSTPASASYFPVNAENDVSCFDLSEVLECQPGKPLQLNSVYIQILCINIIYIFNI